jgi:hypothetical protein
MTPGAPLSPAHATHWPKPLQIGVAPEQSALVAHPTHLCVVSLHAVFGGTQRTRPPGLFVHSTHWPADGPLVRQAGAVGVPQGCWLPVPLLPSHLKQVPPVQTGVAFGQSASVTQPTHWWPALQIGVGALQSPAVTHCTHWLLALSQ